MEVQEAEKCTLLPFSISSEKSSAQRWKFILGKRNCAIYKVDKNEEDKAECTYKLLASREGDVRGSYCSTSIDIGSSISCSEELSEDREISEERVECGEQESRDRSERISDSTKTVETNNKELTSDFNRSTEAIMKDDLVNNEKKLSPEKNFGDDFRSSQTSARGVTNEPLKVQSSNRDGKASEIPRNTSEFLTVRQNIQAGRLANHFLFNSDDDDNMENSFVNQERKESEKQGSHYGTVENPNNANPGPHSETTEHELIDLKTNDTTHRCDKKYASSVSGKTFETRSDSDLQKLTFTSTMFKKNFNPFSKLFNIASKSTEMLVPDEYTTKVDTPPHSTKSYYRVNDAMRTTPQDSGSVQTYRKFVNYYQGNEPRGLRCNCARENKENEEETHSVPLLKKTSSQMDLKNRSDHFSDSRSINEHTRCDSRDLLLESGNLDLKTCNN